MKIYGNNKVLKSQDPTVETGASHPEEERRSEETGSADRNTCSSVQVELSSEARVIEKVREALKMSDHERTARVEALKKQIQQGTYKIDADKIADSMLVDLLKNSR
ncbi:MAG TPA: flagellar biosynthesis anti-sigma factor FlgM [Thermodesulfobacteriaceae bacterium]|nr:flagellar biosynthesis anti-sigma factor FlgM [Thermodesulfobacteriaceae bacterium]